MGWQLITAAAAPPAVQETSNQGVIVALIGLLGLVLSAVIAYAAQTRGSRTSSSPPMPDPKLGERLAVTEAHDQNQDRTLAQLDRHVDGIGDIVERVRWELDDLRAWRDEHIRRHGGAA